MKKGFTLIELLVVVLIIGILAAIALPQYQKAVNKSRLMEAIIQGRSLADAQKLFIIENGEFCKNIDELGLSFSTDKWTTGTNVFRYRETIGGVSIEVSEYGAKKPYLFCYSSTDQGKKLCQSQSMGGQAHHTSGTKEYYLLYR